MQSQLLNSKSQILIVGAGPAGTSAAIRLANKGFAVKLIEREKFPRHKLCGEFISPECFKHFKELGVLDKMFAGGGDRITETCFYAPNGKSVNVPSTWFSENETALGLSRAEMDFQLLQQAKKVGVEVLEETQVVGLLTENGNVCGVKTKTDEISADLIIDATGRARVLGKLAEKQIHNPKSKTQNRFVGFKAHLKNINLEKGRCEIYFFRGGYGGLNYVENGIGNHCFLIKSEIVKEFNGDVEQILHEIIFKNVRAKETLQNATPIFEWLAVSVDGFGVKNLNPAPNLLAIGDAGAFIDPFTGSGMLMAMESGEILATVIKPNLSVEIITDNYQKLYQQNFQKRLQICNLLRRAAFAPNLAKWVISALSLTEKPRQLLAKATRSKLPTLAK
ncbi:MAG TPA: NAD(P)/FAD-dependent oxidoreductase [Pyrinomonadaceae bacterium]|nr:NAD(P)/FAD-dependent oxidoreductase [Pyrinomonadaceae bacterium]